MLQDTKTDIREARHHITQEDFTPESVVEEMYSYLPDEVYMDFSKTILDPCCGIGNLLLYVVRKRLDNCKTADDIYSAISTVYGTELMEDNTQECKDHVKTAILSKSSELGISLDKEQINSILNHNIVNTDMFDWNYDLWCEKNPSLF